MEIVTSWMEEGIEQGLQQGLHEGRERGLQQGLQQGEQNLVLRQLTHRFGELPADVQARIGALAIDQLEQLGEALLDFKTLADLTNWFEQHAKTEDTP